MINSNKIGLFFGSFDPLHIGHLIIAEYMYQLKKLDAIWFVISPQNPLKRHLQQSSQVHRLNMLHAAIKDYPGFEVCEEELSMPQPNYTHATLERLSAKYSQHDFYLIMGSDNLVIFDKWKNHEAILQMCKLYVYPRLDYDAGSYASHDSVELIKAPILEISSTYIRNSSAQGYIPFFMLHKSTSEYIAEKGLYEKQSSSNEP